jgi:asparagine synthase (glutamine-hydrolysing)
MCGIAGLVRVGGAVPEDTALVGRMLSAQVHRGPDGSGIHREQQAVFGHRRLSILDLSSAGAQPMTNEDGTVWLTFNGEIYNYRELRGELISAGHHFRSGTDTEAIVHGYEEWGAEGLLERLRGMFALGLYDSRRGVLLLARDRLGIKPLYYSSNSGRIVFASEVKALVTSGAVWDDQDPNALAGFLLAGSIPSPLTINRHVRSLPAGSYLTWADGKINTAKYWDLSFTKMPTGKPPDVREELDDAVRRHLVSDVPLGVFLSGGVDSAALVALSSKVRPAGIRTLTVVFDEKEWSEAAPAHDIARHFQTEHTEVHVTERDFRDAVPSILAAMDQPTNDGANTYFVSKAAQETGLKVVLSGLGGDEVFWGYPHYRWLASGARWLEQVPGFARLALAESGAVAGRLSGREGWTRLEYLRKSASSGRMYLSMRGFFGPGQVARLLGWSDRQVDLAVEQSFEIGAPCGGVDGFNYLEFKRYMHDQLLRDTDVFSMAHSLEVRVPFLDHRIVELAAHTSAPQKAANGVNKPLLVHAVDDPLLVEAGRRRKRGFSLPMDRWMRSYAGELEEMSQGAEGVDLEVVRDLWSGFREGRLHWSRAWALAVLGSQTMR